MENICIYYDMDSITEEDVTSVINKVDVKQTTHIYKDTVEWPSGVKVEAESLDSERSARYRNELMHAFDRLFDELHSKFIWRKILTCQSLDLLEIARYELFFSIYEQVYSIWVVDRILEKFHPKTLVWVLPKNQSIDVSLYRIQQNLEQRGIQVIFYPKQTDKFRKNRVQELFDYWKVAFSWMKATVVKGADSFTHSETNWLENLSQSSSVLFVENFPNSAKLSVKIAKILQERDEIPYLFIATCVSVMDVVKIERKVLLNDLCPPLIWTKLLLHQFFVACLASFLSRHIVQKKKTELWSDLVQVTAPAFSLAVAKSWMRAVQCCWQLNYVVKKSRPRAVMSTSVYGSFARALTLSAKKISTPSFFIQHGSFNMENYETRILQERILVWGERDRHFWLNTGVQPENIHVTGSPKFDDIAKKKKSRFRDGQVLTDRLRVAYFPSRTGGSTVSAEVSDKMLQIVLEAVSTMPNTHLIIKTKPEDKSKIYEQVKLTKNVELVKNYNAMDVLLDSDVVIVSTSTVGFEACVLDIPLIILDFGKSAITEPYREYDAALFAETVTDLKICLEGIKNNADIFARLKLGRQELTKDMFSGAVPGAAVRVADVITKEACC